MKRLLALLFCFPLHAATTWYVNSARPNDAGAGTSVATAFKTLKAAVRTNIASGDTVIVAGGTYREAFTLNRPAPNASGVTVIGDPRNEYGFTEADGVTLLMPQVPRWTAHTTDDKTSGATAPLTTSTYTNFTWINLWFDGGAGADAFVQSSGGYNHTLIRCLLSASGNVRGIYSEPGADVVCQLYLRNCVLVSPRVALGIYASANPTAECNLQVGLSDCCLYSGNVCIYAYQPASPNYALTGISVTNCTLFGSIGVQWQYNAANAPTLKSVMWRCVIFANIGIYMAGATHVLTNGYNVYHCVTPRLNQNAGLNEQTTYAGMYEWGQSALWFGQPRTALAPIAGSPALGYAHDLAIGTGGTDFLGRVRPSGSGFWGWATNAVGALEFHEMGTREATATNVDSGTYSIKLTGPGDHQISVPVNAQATVLTVRVKRDSNYTGTLPQVQRIAQPELISGDAGETEICVGAANAFETLTFTSFTPTAKGAVILRLISNDTAGTGKVWFDTVSRNY